MMQEFQKNQIELEFQQKQQMLMGGSVDAKAKKKMTPEDIKQMKKDYTNMYFALTSINWGHGGTLGMAWQKALSQMDAFVSTKMKMINHPMGKELLKMHTEFRRNMSKHIMTSEYAEEKLQERHKKLFIERGEKNFNKAKNSLDKIYDKYMPEKTEAKTPVAKSFAIAQQQTHQRIQQILAQQQFQRAA
jgi:5-keto 4-deoxyuronate isomerase